jgi:hypothetical protein
VNEMNVPVTADPGPSSSDDEEKLKANLGTVGKRLAAGFGAVTALFTFAGINSGGVQRLLRNEARLSVLFFVLIGAAIGIGVIIDIIPMERVSWRLGLFAVLAAAVFAFSLVFVADAFWSIQAKTSVPRKMVVAAIALVIVALLLWALVHLVASKMSGPSPNASPPSTTGMPVRAVALLVGLVLFVGGLYGAFHLAAVSMGTKERPEISAKVDGSQIEVTVKSAGLRSDEHVLVLALGRPLRSREFSRMLYASRTGADTDGKVARTFTVQVPPGLEQVEFRATLENRDRNRDVQCNANSTEKACLAIWLPIPPQRPQVSVTFPDAPNPIAPADNHNALVRVTMPFDDPRSKVEVVAWRQGEVALLHRSSPIAGANGLLDYSIVVPVGPSGCRICVVATLTDAKASPFNAAALTPGMPCMISSRQRSAMEIVVPG